MEFTCRADKVTDKSFSWNLFAVSVSHKNPIDETSNKSSLQFLSDTPATKGFQEKNLPNTAKTKKTSEQACVCEIFSIDVFS